MEQKNILELKKLCKDFPLKEGFFRRRSLKVLQNISLQLKYGETLGVVGESGCGKSTLGKSILRLHPVTSGKVIFKGQDITDWKFSQLRRIRPAMQMIFQDPYSSLNPRRTILQTLIEPILVHKLCSKDESYERVSKLVEKVGLDKSCLAKYPRDFSGGQRQRIAIARALCLRPDLIIADEPVSALDVSIQSQVLNLLIELRKEFGFSCLFISHDLAVIEYISDKVAVIYLGEIVEYTDKNSLFSGAKHPYTNALLASVPNPVFRKERKKKISLIGELKEKPDHGVGCAFYSRCPKATEHCKMQKPELKNLSQGSHPHLVSCHYAE